MSKMKILMLDIETSPAVVYCWALFKQDISVDQIITPTSVLSWAAKWQGEDKVMFGSANGKLEGRDFDKMIRGIHKLLGEADAVCHFNGKSFDIPRLNQEFLRLNLPPPPPIPNIDLKNVVMSKFSMTSSKLAFVGPYLKIGGKVKNAGWSLWIQCLKGNKAAWADMEKYNKQDVVLLEKLYDKVLPWIDQHPNMNHFVASEKGCCTNCGSIRLLSNGIRRATTYAYRRFQCQDCGKWMRERMALKLPDKIKIRD